MFLHRLWQSESTNTCLRSNTQHFTERLWAEDEWWTVSGLISWVAVKAGVVVKHFILVRWKLWLVRNRLIHHPWPEWEFGPRWLSPEEERGGGGGGREREATQFNCEQVVVQTLSRLEKQPFTSRCHSCPNWSLTSHFTFPEQSWTGR